MRENTDQENSEYRYFLRSDYDCCHVHLPECFTTKVSEETLYYSRAKMGYKIKLIQMSARLNMHTYSKPGVILDQNCVQFSDAALDCLFFSKVFFIKNSANML